MRMRIGILFCQLISQLTSRVYSFALLPVLQRQTIVDIPHFFNQTYVPEVDLTFAVPAIHSAAVLTKTIIMIPGIDFSALSLVQFVPQLQNHYNMVFVCSGRRNVSTTFQQIAETVQEYICERDLKEVTCLGESFGALVALSTCSALPSRVQTVILMNSASAYLHNCRPQFEVLKHSSKGYNLRLLFFIMSQVRFHNRNDNVVLNMQMLTNILYFDQECFDYKVKHWLIPGLQAAQPERLKQVRASSLVIYGEQDDLFDSKTEALTLASSLVHSSVISVKHGGHQLSSKSINLQALIALIV
jgi:pimeloyl-ACP methyl ester carboxylesterase